MGIISPDDQERLCRRLLDYYRNLYPEQEFTRTGEKLDHEQIGEIHYTYSGEHTEATAKEKMRMIDEAIRNGYSTPIIILRKDGKDILLDGHRRARVAFSEGLEWDAIIIRPSNEKEHFGIEDMILGTVADLYGK